MIVGAAASDRAPARKRPRTAGVAGERMIEYNACVDLLDRNVHDGRGEHPAVVTRQRTVTYAELLDEVAATAAGLRRLGVAPEQRVAMVMLDSIEFYDVFLAAMRIGAIPAPVNPLLPGRDIGGVVAASRARVLVVSSGAGRRGRCDPRGRARRVDRRRHWLARVGRTSTRRHGRRRVRGQPGTSHPASGCARRDRPGGRSWRCTVTSTCASPPTPMATQVLGIRPDDRCYSVGPMFHAYGLGNSLSFPFSVGATAIVEPTRPPTPALVGEIARSLQPTLLFCIPTFYAALCATDLPADTFASVRWGVSAAEPLPADTFERFEERYGVRILDGIGSTEMTHIYISNSATALRPGTSGRPVPGYDVEVVDDDGQPVAADVPGHLIVSGDSMAVGYWCDSAATRYSFGFDRMRTGDMYSRCSVDGYYTYLGRSDDMLRIGGEWVSPAEVEAVLVRNPAVLEAAVVGYRDDDGLQRPVAFVVATPGAAVDEAELAGAVQGRARRVQATPALPRSSTPCRRRRPARSSATSCGRSR